VVEKRSYIGMIASLAKPAVQKVSPRAGAVLGGALTAARVHGTMQVGASKGRAAGDVLHKAQKTAPAPRGVQGVSAGDLSHLSKNADLFSPADKRMFRQGAYAALGSAATATMIGLARHGVSGAASGVGGIFERHQRRKLFAEVLRRNPGMRSQPRAQEYFDLIMTYAPSLGRHPTAIGDFLVKQMQYPVSSTEFLHSVAQLEGQVQKNTEGQSANQVGLAFEAGAKGPVDSYFAERGKHLL